MNFPKDTVMKWAKDGLPAYQKVDDLEWGSWRSLQYDLEKPLKDRFGFRQTDEGVYNFYKTFMKFELPKPTTK